MPLESSTQIDVSGLSVRIVRKDIKHLHLGVYPPDGRLRVAAPLNVSDDAVRLAVVRRLGWIHKQRTKFAEQARQSPREMVSGESHYVFGRRVRLRVIEHEGAGRVQLRGRDILELRVRPGLTADQREAVVLRWHRARLLEVVPPLLATWEARLGVAAAEWRIRKMKTKWGSCSIGPWRIWLNVELAKKPVECLEYVVVHELMHLIEPTHNARFVALMDEHLPDWRRRRAVLGAGPLGHAEWGG